MVDIIVTLDGETDTSELAYDIMERVRKAAEKAVLEAGRQHLEMARDNVANAYRYGYPEISLAYAITLIPYDTAVNMTKDEKEAMAQTLIKQKDGMVITGRLLQGIKMGSLTNENDLVAVELCSLAPYSKNLEWGILFGKATGKERRFFTSPLHLHTIPKMVSELKKNVREIN